MSLLALGYIQAQESPLAKGTILKIKVQESAVYKITGQVLAKQGINLASLGTKNMRLWGNGGAMLPQPNNEERPGGLKECAYQIVGLEDGTFSNNDYLLFYAEGPNTFQYDSKQRRFVHQTNLYATYNSYFLVVDNGPGIQISDLPSQGVEAVSTDIYDYFYFHEKELTNLLQHSGRQWVGERLDSVNAKLELNLDKQTDFVPNTQGIMHIKVAGRTFYSNTKYTVQQQNEAIGQLETLDISNYIYGTKAEFATKLIPFELKSSSPKFSLNIANAIQRSLGHLDWFSLQAQRKLNFAGSKFDYFQSIAAAANEYTKFNITVAANQKIWDISQGNVPKNQLFTAGGFTAFTKGMVKRYIVFEPDAAKQAAEIEKIKNQKIKTQSKANLLIVCPKAYGPAAQKLADYRRQHDKLSSVVVDIGHIYNEYSGGKVDPTALRDFVREMYQKPGDPLKYLLILADASYDFRNINAEANEQTQANFIPSYQSIDSADPILSYSSDDYFGFLEDHEGAWTESADNADNHSLDIGVGRIPVNSLEQAQQVVDKIIQYSQNADSFGTWRNKIVLTSDDGDGNLHQTDSEDLANLIKEKGKDYSIQKIYVDAYPRLTAAPFGRLSPGTNTAVKSAFNEGSLIFNYVGHGGVENLSDEKILLREELANWNNKNQLPLMVTATCEFGRYDDPGDKSGAEMALLNPNGGAIALLTTTRPVVSVSNKVMNEAFYKALLQNEAGPKPRLGDIIKQSKNNAYQQVLNRNFSLLGDPSLKLSYPSKSIKINTLNNKNFIKNDTLKARQNVVLEGTIADYFTQEASPNFNGQLLFTLFDKETTLRTVGNNKNLTMNYKSYTDRLAEGVAKVENGKFKIQFTLPSYIKYQYGAGRLELYAIDQTNAQDATTAYDKIVIGGEQNTLISDTKGPEIKLTFSPNDLDKSGKVNTVNASLVIDLKDDSGINLNSYNSGKEILLNLDNTTYYQLNSAYKAVLGDGPAGQVSFLLQNLSVGKHSLQLTAWDIFDNKSVKNITFEVDTVQNNGFKLLKAFPNPVGRHLTFEMNNPFDYQKEIRVDFFTLQGLFIHSFTSTHYGNDPYIQVQIPTQVVQQLKGKGRILISKVQLSSDIAKKSLTGSNKLMVLD